MPWNPSQSLRNELRTFVTDDDVPYFSSRADEFVEAVVAEADSVADWFDDKFPTRRELQCEIDGLLSALKNVERRLRDLSPDLDRMLGPEPHPLTIAEQLQALTTQAESAQASLADIPPQLRPVVYRNRVAQEFALRVLRVLSDYGIPPSSTHHPHYGQTSKALRILKLVGDDIGVYLSVDAWRDVILQVQFKVQ